MRVFGGAGRNQKSVRRSNTFLALSPRLASTFGTCTFRTRTTLESAASFLFTIRKGRNVSICTLRNSGTATLRSLELALPEVAIGLTRFLC